MSEEAGSAECTDADIARYFADKSRTYYVGSPGRLGFLALCGLTEYTYFHPTLGPASNDEFLFFVVDLVGLKYTMFGVPQAYEDRVNEIARALKLNPVNEGMPVVFGSDGVAKFPGTDEALAGRSNVFILERGDPLIYHYDQDFNKLVQSREGALIDLLLERGPFLTPEQASAMIWSRQ